MRVKVKSYSIGWVRDSKGRVTKRYLKKNGKLHYFFCKFLLLHDYTFSLRNMERTIMCLNAYKECARTIKAQYNNTSVANYLRRDSFGASGVIDF